MYRLGTPIFKVEIDIDKNDLAIIIINIDEPLSLSLKKLSFMRQKGLSFLTKFCLNTNDKSKPFYTPREGPAMP